MAKLFQVNVPQGLSGVKLGSRGSQALVVLGH